MKFYLPIALTIVTATLTYWYEDYTKKYQSLFLPAILNAGCYLAVAIFSYFWEGPRSVSGLKSALLEPYMLPYLILNMSYVCFWYFLTISKGAAYTGIYESSYILLLVIMNVLFKGEKFDVQFFIGALIVCIGIVVIEYE